MKKHLLLPLLCVSVLACFGCRDSNRHPHTLLNVSYDPTRELYKDVNAAFIAVCHEEGLADVRVEQSHGGSGRQARAVMEGLDADVVTLALGYDIDILAHYGKLLPENWSRRLPNGSAPYYSTIVFLVRQGNPKAIHDWSDLTSAGVEVIMPNPKTSGGARWNYLAAWFWSMSRTKSAEATMDYMVALFKHIPVLSTGARGATNTFVQQERGDVLVGWENEALLTKMTHPEAGYEIVYPSVSIKAEPPVAVVDLNTELHGTRTLAEKYLQFLYSNTGQNIVARHFYRPCNPDIVDEKLMALFKNIPMVTIDEFDGWLAAQAEHFGRGGTFEKVWERLYRVERQN